MVVFMRTDTQICGYAFFNVTINLESIWLKKCTFVLIGLVNLLQNS